MSSFYVFPTASNTQFLDIKALVLNRIPAWQSCLLFQAKAFCTDSRNGLRGKRRWNQARAGALGDQLSGEHVAGLQRTTRS